MCDLQIWKFSLDFYSFVCMHSKQPIYHFSWINLQFSLFIWTKQHWSNNLIQKPSLSLFLLTLLFNFRVFNNIEEYIDMHKR